MHKHEAGKNGGPPVRDNVIVMSGFGLSTSSPFFISLERQHYTSYFLDVRCCLLCTSVFSSRKIGNNSVVLASIDGRY